MLFDNQTLTFEDIGMRVLAQDLNPLKNTKRVIRKIFGEDGPVGPITSATIMAGVLAHVIPEMATKMADLPQVEIAMAPS